MHPYSLLFVFFRDKDDHWPATRSSGSWRITNTKTNTIFALFTGFSFLFLLRCPFPIFINSLSLMITFFCFVFIEILLDLNVKLCIVLVSSYDFWLLESNEKFSSKNIRERVLQNVLYQFHGKCRVIFVSPSLFWVQKKSPFSTNECNISVYVRLFQPDYIHYTLSSYYLFW